MLNKILGANQATEARALRRKAAPATDSNSKKSK
jgi:hypothetical protein